MSIAIRKQAAYEMVDFGEKGLAEQRARSTFTILELSENARSHERTRTACQGSAPDE